MAWGLARLVFEMSEPTIILSASRTSALQKKHKESGGSASMRGPGTRITALTFDFWNTLYSADGGLDEVRPRRRQALRALLGACGVQVGDDALAAAYRHSFDAYMAAWNAGLHFGAREQVGFMLEHFGVSAAGVAQELILDTAREIEDASLLAPLQLLPGVKETIPRLAVEGYRLGLISDTSLTPGRILVHFLEKDGLLDSFGALTFSDVTGYTKPDRRMFEATLAQLGAQAHTSAHVGDTPRTDIAGAQQLGILAIRCAAAVDHPEPPEADHVIHDHAEIPGLLAALGQL